MFQTFRQASLFDYSYADFRFHCKIEQSLLLECTFFKKEFRWLLNRELKVDIQVSVSSNANDVGKFNS